MSADPVSVLWAIVEEVAGSGKPFSADSYLPPHLVFDAQKAVEEAQAEVPASALEAHETILLARLAKADEMIASLRAEIDSLRRPNIPGQPPGVVSGPANIKPDPLRIFGLNPEQFHRLTACGRRQECDE